MAPNPMKTLAKKTVEEAATPTTAVAVVSPHLTPIVHKASQSVLEDLPRGKSFPYLAFAPQKPGTQRFAEFQRDGYSAADMYVQFPNGNKVRLSPAKLMVHSSFAYYAVIDNAYAVTAAQLTKPDKSDKRYWRLSIEAVLLAFDDNDVFMVRATIRSPQAEGIVDLIRATEAAALPDFAKTSQAHTVAAQIPFAWGRVVGEFEVQSRTAKGSGNIYHPLRCQVRPINLDEIRALGEWCKEIEDKNSIACSEMSAVMNDYRQTVTDLEQKFPALKG